MPRITSNIGVLNDLTVGTGNYVHSDNRWVGGSGDGTDSLDNRQYRLGNIVSFNNVLYECILDNIDRLPTNTTYWAAVTSTGGGGGGTGNGFTLVDSIPTTGTLGDHIRTNSDLRGYVMGSNAYTQVDGQTSIQILGSQTGQLEFTEETDVQADQWQQVPTYFIGTGEYDG